MATFEKNFLSLKNDMGLIRIPGIQRDYAEGRQTTRIKEIRRSFLNELLKIVYSKSGDKLHLDFIYGYKRDDAFEPLDGQQRLTTLFLLYWYFSSEENNCLCKNEQACLSYATKQSTIDFCNELVKHQSTKIIENFKNRNKDKDDKDKISLFKFIRKLGWFKWQWRYDSSISSMLVVIEEIYNLINENYKEAKPEFKNLDRISFHLLSLDEFNMGDELYVKMNARGKQLSSFDIMKSVLEEEIQLQKLSGTKDETDWRTKIDGDWINYFWQKYCNGKSAEEMQQIDYRAVEMEVEMQLKRLIQRMICIQFYNRNNIDQTKWMISKQNEFENALAMYCDLAWKYRVINKNKQFLEELNFNLLIRDIDILFFKDEKQQLHNVVELLDINWLPNKNIWDEFLKEPQRDLQVAFFAMIAFLRLYPAAKISGDPIRLQDFKDWMRFVRNIVLLSNTIQQIDKPERQKDAINALYTILEKYHNSNSTMREFLAQIDYIKGLENATLDEEKLKFNLRIENEAWNYAINTLENNNYLWGQIIAPLEWSFTEGVVDIDKFKKYSEKLELLFPLTSNKIDPNQFRAALLCLGDYGTWKSNTEYFLCENNSHRDRSFKSFLRSRNSKYGEVIKNLIDKWNTEYQHCNDFDKLFKALRDKEVQKISGWRKYVILKPNILEFAINSKLWVDKNEHVFLRQKIQSDTQRREIFLAYLDSEINKNNHQLKIHDWYPVDDKQNTLEISTNQVQISLAENGSYEYSDLKTTKVILSSDKVIDKLRELNILQ